MRLCLITDRRRLGVALDAPADRWADLLIAQARGAVAGGVDLLQLREPDLDAGVLAALVRAMQAVVQGSRTRVMVNDRVDVALAAGAAGVHLRESSVEVAAVRRLSPTLGCGASVHDASGVRRRVGAAYLIAGTVLPTVSKTMAPAHYLGWDGLRSVVVAAASTPVLAIGGLGLQEIPRVAAAGAAGMAAIGAFIPGPGEDVAAFVQKRAEILRLAFDSAGGVT